MRLHALLAALLVCTARSAAQLSDQPLLLPGRPSRPAQAQSAAAAAAGTAAVAAREPVERYGYFSPRGSPQRRLFYWFYQARNLTSGAAINATTTPLIAWFNGGPGCSSLWGMFFENGPYTLTSSLQLAPNNWTWAGVGHMLYIDQPIGTGLSYSTQPGDETTSQLDVARTVAAFLQAFLKAPAYAYLARNPLYLTGESFAGHYLPAIAAYMRLNTPDIQLAGVAMGNPCTSAPAMYQSYPDYALANGLISTSLHASVVANLASCKLQAAVCGVLDSASCAQATYYCESRIWGDLLTAPGSRLARLNPYNIKDTAASCGTTQLYNCYARLDSRLEAYIDAHRARLGVPAGIQYRACADAPYFALQPDIAASYDDLVAALVDGGLPVMVYSGINDFVCSWMSSRQWLDSLPWSKQLAWISAPRKTWAGGSFRRLGPLAFVRVARAGHMVPLDQPSLSLAMLRSWIAHGEPAPPTAGRVAGR